MKIIDTPQTVVLKSGRSVKVLRVTGEEGMVIPEHFCTREAVLVVQRGSAILEMEGTVFSLARDQTVIIPGGANHTLNIKERFQAIVMMNIDSEIKFVNQ